MGRLPRLVVGLGNPTDRYRDTRHNIGRQFIEFIASGAKTKFVRDRQVESFHLPVFFGLELSEPVVFAKLTCFMNESGVPIKALMAQMKITSEQLLVCTDDFMIPFGTMRLRIKGSSGGHNGLKSIIEQSGTEEFGRLRFGVGPVPGGEDPADFVLDNFSTIEIDKFPTIFAAARDGLKTLFSEGYERSMNVLNGMTV